MATVYKRGKSRTWWVRFVWRGTEVRRSAHTTSKAIAQRYLAQLQAEHGRLDRGGRPRRTYKEAVERFWIEYAPNLKPLAAKRYGSSFTKLEESFGKLYLDEITRGRLADYAAARLRGGVTGATVRRDLAALSSVCSCAVAWDWIDINPVRQFSKRHIKESRPRTSYTAGPMS